MTRRLAVAVVAAVCVLVAGCSATPTPAPPSPSVDLVAARRAAGIADCPQPDGVPVDGGLPSMSLECLGGDTTVQLSSLRGPLVINLWAQWCLPCRQEAKILQQFHAEDGDKVAMLGIDYNDPQPELAVEFAQLAGWKYPQLADMDKAVEAALAVPGIPMSLLIDADGRIAARHPGPFDSVAELRAWVDEGLS